MRKLDPASIGRYLARVGEQALASVGAYQVEGQGIQLFERIEGDYLHDRRAAAAAAARGAQGERRAR